MYDKIKKWYCEDCLTQRDIAEVLGVGEISVRVANRRHSLVQLMQRLPVARRMA